MAELPDNDERFTYGLTLDVAKVLADHGYPQPVGSEFVALQQALFSVLYKETTLGVEPVG